MKRLALAALLALGTCTSLPAQQKPLLMFVPAAQPSTVSPASSFNFVLVPELAPPATPFESFPATPNAASANAVPASAAPGNVPAMPSPPPYSDDTGYRWDLAVGYEYIRFNSAPFDSNLSGIHTDLTYNLNNWFGLEGSLISAWGTHVFSDELSKYVLYTVGGRINAGPSRHRLTPWAHALIGGAHLNPQVANSSKNGFALQAGGGVDYAFRPRLSLRAEADYVRTQLYSSSQNNFQLGFGAVLHF